MPGHALIDHGRLLEAIEHEADLLLAAAHDVPPESPVRTCPGWTVGEVVRHLGSVYRVVLGWLVEGGRPREWQRDPAPGQSVESYLRAGLTELREVLSWHDPAEPAATWWPADHTYGFWFRRMAHETTLHRVDVEEAAGAERGDIAEDFAVDGVDEALTLWFAHKLPLLGLSGTRKGVVAINTGGHYWVARAGPARTTAERSSRVEVAGADAVVSGRPADVYLWLWGRQRPGTVTVAGDEDAVGQLWALLRLATR